MLVSSFRGKRFIIIGICFIVCALTFGVRLTEYILTGKVFGDSWLTDLSLVVVPLMSMWQILPVVYYIYICSFLRLSFKNLKEKLENDIDLMKQPIKHYYDRFIHLTVGTHLFSEFIGPFVFFTLGLAVVVLCFTIYFVINSDMALQIPQNATEAEIVNIRFIPVWAGIQICAALASILAFCIAGLRVNEMVKKLFFY